MWTFFDNNPMAFWGILACVTILISVILIAVIRGRLGYDGKYGRIFGGGTQKTRPGEELVFTNAQAFIFSAAINQWQKSLDRSIEEKTSRVVSDCVRIAVSTTDTTAATAKLEYGRLLRQEHPQLTVEDNYQIIIYGFVIDQIKISIKDVICNAIREDRLEEKTENEILSIGRTCKQNAVNILSEKSAMLRSDLLDRIVENYGSRIQKMADEMMEITKSRYRKLKEEIASFILEQEASFKEELKIKFPFLPADAIEDIVGQIN